MVVGNDRGDYYDELEVMPPEARQQYRDRRLREAIRRAYAHAPAAREILDRAGVAPHDVRTVGDLEKIPITRKTDLIELQRHRYPPFGGFLTVPAGQVERVFIAPGPIYEPQHASTIEWFAKPFFAAGFTEGDVVVNTFTYHLSPAGILLHEALRHCGCTVVPTGTGNTEIQVRTMHDLGVSGYVGTPSFLMALIHQAESMGYVWKRDLSLQRAWFTGEPLTESVRGTLERDYGIATAQAYAVTEPGGALAYECRNRSGMHLMDEYVIEIVDPVTGRQLGPGELGEVVVTPTHNVSWGLIRFGTGDMSYYVTEPCSCGRTSHRLARIMGRTTDAVKVRGMFVVARQVEDVMSEFSQVLGFRLVVGRSGQRDEVALELEPKETSLDRDQLSERLRQRFQSLCRVKLDHLRFVAPGAIPQGSQRIVDERKWE
ncbi:MAG: phenylacetate--CoA ligase family protein [Chloroflexota bacterium]